MPNSGFSAPLATQARAKLGLASTTPWPLTAASKVRPRSTNLGPLWGSGQLKPAARNHGVQGSNGVRAAVEQRRANQIFNCDDAFADGAGGDVELLACAFLAAQAR